LLKKLDYLIEGQVKNLSFLFGKTEYHQYKMPSEKKRGLISDGMIVLNDAFNV
jgi:hypothetical protein